MKIKLMTLLIALSCLLCACAGGEEAVNNQENAKKLNAAIENINGESRVSGEYMLEVTFGEGTTLYYAMGDVAWDKKSLLAYTEFDQTYLAASSRVKNYFSNGKMISVAGGETIESERESDELFSKFPYASILPHGKDCGDIKVGSNSIGTTYTFTVTNAKSLSNTIIGEDIYTIAKVLKKPQPEKTQYGDIKCIFTVKDEKIVSCRYEYSLKLFDTPPYVPGYSVPESEYTLDVKIVAKITYKSFGNGVEIAEYSGESAEESTDNTSESSENISE